MKQIGIAIMAFNRPFYLRRMIHSLEKNNLARCDVHLFQDGAMCPFTGIRLVDESAVEENVSIWDEAELPNKVLHMRPHNYSCAAQRADIMPFMAEKYEWFIQLDADVLLSPNYIAIMRKLFKQFEGNPKAGAISPGFSLDCEDVDANMDALKWKFTHFWANGYWSKKWKLAEPNYMEYYEIVKEFPYRDIHLHAQKVMDWDAELPIHRLDASSDSAVLRAIWNAGQDVLRLVVNRATGIGDYGLHSTPELMAKMGVGHQKIYCSEEELGIDEFRIIGETA